MADSPDFSGYFGNSKLSDCTVALVEEPPPGCGSAKRRQQELPGHSMVLVAFSGYCTAKLESWDSARAAEDGGQNEYFVLRKRIEVPVPTGQLELGLLLLKGMYCPNLDIELTQPVELTQEQLLQLLRLADRYEVPKVAKAVAAAFAAIPVQQLQWDSILAVYMMPAGCFGLPACQPLYNAAAVKLQDELGDLELIWSSSSNSSSSSATAGAAAADDGAAAAAGQAPCKQQLLLGLPFAALAALLSDDRTRVTSENTVVFYTIRRWYTHQQQQSGDAAQQQSEQELQALLRLIRMRHCSQLGVLDMAHSSLARLLFSWEELMLGCCLASSGTGQTVADSGCSVLKKYPAWKDAKRPASSVQQLSFEWALPLSELERCVADALKSFR